MHSSNANVSKKSLNDDEKETPLARRLTRPQLGTLFACIDTLDAVAAAFDGRPALKYLIQKLIDVEQPANLYRLSVAAQSIKLQSIYELAKQSKPSR